MKTYKGFKEDMTCKGFKYEVGEEYECDEVIMCQSGFHACEAPIDCFKFYGPAYNSVYHEVEQGGEIVKEEKNSKVASTKIKIGRRLNILELIQKQIDYIRDNLKKSNYAFSSNNSDHTIVTGNNGSVASIGCDSSIAAFGSYGSSAVSSGDGNQAIAIGNDSVAATSGIGSSAIAIGYTSNAVTIGELSTSISLGCYNSAKASGLDGCAAVRGAYSLATTSGMHSSAMAHGKECSAIVSGKSSVGMASGYKSSAVAATKNTIAFAFGKDAKCKGVIGSYIILTEWDYPCEEIIGVKSIYIDGKIYKENTWYVLKNGEVIEYEEE